jgi:hypothetical protein
MSSGAGVDTLQRRNAHPASYRYDVLTLLAKAPGLFAGDLAPLAHMRDRADKIKEAEARIRKGKNLTPVAMRRLAAKKSEPSADSRAANAELHSVQRVIDFRSRLQADDVVSDRIGCGRIGCWQDGLGEGRLRVYTFQES